MRWRWRIDLLGILTVQGNGSQISRFRTLKTSALLGYLAYELRPHTREALSTRLWPEADLRNGRNSLSVALSSLRTQLEPPGVEFGSVLIANRNLVSLNPDAVTTDIAEFRAHVAALEAMDQPATANEAVSEQITSLQKAVDLYRGRLLEGLYEDWILDEGQRLESQFLTLLDRLLPLLYCTRNYGAMQHYAERGVAVAPWREAGHRHLIQAMAARGQAHDALRYYRHWQEGTGTESEAPSQATQALIAEIQQALAQGHPEDIRERGASSLPAVPLSSALKSDDKRTLPSSEKNHELGKARINGANSLPLRRTRFFGRRVQLHRLVEQLSPTGTIKIPAQRLVTLTGMGGSGKTRLAIEVAHQLLDRYAGRVWFITLANLSSPALLDVALRDALQIVADPQALAIDQVVEFLSDSPGLMVLDNFEALLPAGAAWLTILQERLPNLTCLVTSRQRLSVEGEKEMVVRPLPVPRNDASPDIKNLLRYAGIQLFVDRAQAARPDFGLTRRNAAAVTQLCNALEGVPLALELAAARSSALSPSQMLEQWGIRAELLQSSRRDLPLRHRSMQAAIEASYGLLPTEMQEFFKRQWVFRGGWTPEAAAQVCDEPRALHFAAQLRACSLLHQQERVDTVRFASLETLRDFAGDQLTLTQRENLCERHAFYCLQQAEANFASRAQMLQPKHVARLLADLDNYRAALEWCHRSHPLWALRLAAALWPFWESVSSLEEGRANLDQALQAAPHAPQQLLAQAFLGAGRLAYHQDFEAAQPMLDKALALFRELDDKQGIATALCRLSTLLMNRHDPRARAYAQEALDLAHHLGDALIESEATYCLATMSLGMCDMKSAHSAVEVCLAFNRKTGNRRNLTESLDVMGMTYWAMGEWEMSGAMFEEALALARELRWLFMEAHALWGISAVARAQGNIPRALEAARESARLMMKGHFHWMVPYAVANLAHAKLESGEVESAVLLLGAVEAQHEVLGTPLMPLFFATYDHYQAKARAALNIQHFTLLWEQGRAMSFEDAIAFGLQK